MLNNNIKILLVSSVHHIELQMQKFLNAPRRLTQPSILQGRYKIVSFTLHYIKLSTGLSGWSEGGLCSLVSGERPSLVPGYMPRWFTTLPITETKLANQAYLHSAYIAFTAR